MFCFFCCSLIGGHLYGYTNSTTNVYSSLSRCCGVGFCGQSLRLLCFVVTSSSICTEQLLLLLLPTLSFWCKALIAGFYNHASPHVLQTLCCIIAITNASSVYIVSGLKIMIIEIMRSVHGVLQMNTAQDAITWHQFEQSINTYGSITWEAEDPSMSVDFRELTISINNTCLITEIFKRPQNLYLYLFHQSSL